jgi:hypothetical protein
MELAAFIESHVKGLRRESAASPPRPVTCLAVKRVAKQCVAARAGVVAGDLLAMVDRSPASRRSPKLYDDRSAKRLLSFYSRARRELVELETTGIEIGVELDHTAEGIRARFKAHEVDLKALERLWELGECKTLLELCREALRQQGWQETPVLLFEGVGLWEAGQYAQGLERINGYLSRYGSNWTMNFAAIGIHYLGLELLRQGHKEAGLAKLQRGFDYFPTASTAEVIAEITGIEPPIGAPRWLGRAFPVDYSLPTIEGERTNVSFATALQAMAPQQLLCVCLLASYRSNGPYYDLLNRLHNFLTWFAAYLAGVHVLTTKAERYPDRPYHYAREDELRALPVPFEVLLEDGAVVQALEPSGSPFVLLVGRDGTIACEGDLDTVDFWDALASR